MRPPPVELDGIGGMLIEGGFTEGSKQDASHPETVQLKVCLAVSEPKRHIRATGAASARLPQGHVRTLGSC